MSELAKARSAAAAADKTRTEALVDAIAHLVPRPDLGPCPVPVPVVGSNALLGDTEPDHAPTDWRSIRANQMMVVDASAAASAPSVRLKHITEMLDFEQGNLDAPRPGQSNIVADVIRWARYYADPKSTPWEMVVVAERRLDAKLLDRDKFRSGLIMGVAFVYSYVEEKVVCAGAVLAENSDMLSAHGVKTEDGKDFDLAFDLENEAFRSAARGLSLAGPRATSSSGAPPDAGTPPGEPAPAPKGRSH